MWQAIFLGLFSGVILSLGFGSVFFALIQTSIDHGYKAGIKIASGVLIGDFLLIGLALVGTSFLPQIPHFDGVARGIGSLLLIGLGLAQFRATSLSHKVVQAGGMTKHIYFIGKGFVLNVVNPVNFFSWVLLSASLKTYQFDQVEEIVCLSICLLTIFVCESGFAISAHEIKKKLSDQAVENIKRVSGIIFLGIAGKLLWDLIMG